MYTRDLHKFIVSNQKEESIRNIKAIVVVFVKIILKISTFVSVADKEGVQMFAHPPPPSNIFISLSCRIFRKNDKLSSEVIKSNPL